MLILAILTAPAMAFEPKTADGTKAACSASRIREVKRVVLVVVDSLAADALEKAELPALERLAKRGCRYRKVYLPLPADRPKRARDFPWKCQAAAPILVTGTPFIGIDGVREAMIQDQLAPEQSAYFANTKNFNDTARNVKHAHSRNHKPTGYAVGLGRQVIRTKEDVRFVRVHLRHTNKYGVQVGSRHRAEEPWHRQLWHEGSPYLKACKEADKEIGDLVNWMEETGRMKGTVLMVCGIQGMSSEGGKNSHADGRDVTTLIVYGEGVIAGREFESCQIYDVAPTVTGLLGARPPQFTIGRALEECFDGKAAPPEEGQFTKRLNAALRRFEKLPVKKRAAFKKAGFMTIDDIPRWHEAARKAAGAEDQEDVDWKECFSAFVKQQEDLLAGQGQEEAAEAEEGQ
jgi:hypothetical protein